MSSTSTTFTLCIHVPLTITTNKDAQVHYYSSTVGNHHCIVHTPQTESQIQSTEEMKQNKCNKPYPRLIAIDRYPKQEKSVHIKKTQLLRHQQLNNFNNQASNIAQVHQLKRNAKWLFLCN